MARPVVYDADLRDRLIATAADHLASGGEQALSLRAVAHAADTSTNAIYTLFGNKRSLVDAVIAGALTSFAQAQAAAPSSDDPVLDLRALGGAYRTWTLARPALYAVIFGGRTIPGPGEVPPALSDAMAPLIERVQHAMEAGVLRAAPPQHVAVAIWACVHGAVSLEAQGLVDAEDYERVLDVVLRGWAPEPASCD